jgi:hypothetical protein
MMIGRCGDRNCDRLSVTFAELPRRRRLVTGPGLVTDSVGPSLSRARDSASLAALTRTVALAAARAGVGPVK